MLKNLTPEDIGGGLNLVDIGCSGQLDKKWAPLAGLINYVGFDPNAEECERLNEEPSPFRSRLFLPHAVFDGGEHTLHKTESIYCYSLLKPDLAWLGRFAYRDLFAPAGEETIATRRLDDLDVFAELDVDAVKVDSQGLDRRILEHGERLLSRALFVEAEPGFLQNYEGEDCFADVDVHLRERGWLLFDLELFRSGRANALEKASPKRQLLWCQGTWMRDLAAPGAPAPTRAKGLKALLLCAVGGFWDFGLELAQAFHARGLLSEAELRGLERPEAWDLLGNSPERQEK
jgi:hypothetical protein